MARTPTAEQVAALEVAYDQATDRRNDGAAARTRWEQAKEALVDARQKYRTAEETAGRRNANIPGGDAVKEGKN